MRTIRRQSLKLNKGKFVELEKIAKAFGKEKNAYLKVFNSDRRFAQIKSQRQLRDKLVKDKYKSENLLQARMWKLALKDSSETVEKIFFALSQELRGKIGGKKSWNETQKHYSYWLIKDTRRFAKLVSQQAESRQDIELNRKQKRQVSNYIRRQTRKQRGNRPQVKLFRSFALDANCYRIFCEKGRQYISVMNLQGHKRIIIPLLGSTPIDGTIRVVLFRESNRVEIHYTSEVKKASALKGETRALDAGVSEVFTDNENQRYGKNFGTVLSKGSEELCDKGRKRNKLHQIAKKAKASGNYKKAKHIKKYNLGNKKQKKHNRKLRKEINRQINTAINQVVDTHQPKILITEKLDIRAKAQSKKISRKVSLWARSELKERLEFKASVKGFDRKQVNAAYSSQTCSECGFVHRKNRQADKFQCLWCGHAGFSDHVAAINLKGRLNDPEITLYTPLARVKQILLERFIARFGKPAQAFVLQATVSGRTPDTSRPNVMNLSGGANRQVEGLKSANTTLVNRRAKLPLQSHLK